MTHAVRRVGGFAVASLVALDAPSLGDSGSYTGYAVQTGGTQVGAPN